MKLEIENRVELDLFMKQHFGNHLVAIKGKPPEGATYEDGDIILRDVNIGWMRKDTGETVDIIYKGVN